MPIAEDRSVSDVIHGGKKWVHGLRWDEIDNLVLRRGNGGRNKDIDLRLAPMVMDELAKLPVIPASGPVIGAPGIRLSLDGDEFRRWWRKVAHACGIPKSVYTWTADSARTSPRNMCRRTYRSATPTG